jgi:hypothetical protein
MGVRTAERINNSADFIFSLFFFGFRHLINADVDLRPLCHGPGLSYH